MAYSPYKIFFNTVNNKYIFYDSRDVTYDDMRLDKDHSYSAFNFDTLEECDIGSITIELANMQPSTILSIISCNDFVNICTRKLSPYETYNHLCDFFSKPLSLGIMNKIYDLTLSETFSEYAPDAHYIYFHNWIESLFYMPISFCQQYVDFQQFYSFNYEPKKIELFISFKNNLFNSIYAVPDFRTLIYFDIGKIAEKSLLIKQCENCNKYFIPQKRSDEIYCTNIYKDNKTCKQIGYENKIQNNEFMKAYRSAYKTQRARIKYHSDNPNYELQHVIPWTNAAKKALKLFSSQNDIKGFKQWLQDNKDAF